MQEEIAIIKEWSDQKAAELGYTDTPNNNEDINQDQPNEDINQNAQTIYFSTSRNSTSGNCPSLCWYK